MTSVEEKVQPRLKQRYRGEIRDALNTQFNYTNVMQIPGVVGVAQGLLNEKIGRLFQGG